MFYIQGAKLNEDTGTLTCPIMPNKKLLIFVSPKSGSGKAFSIFKQRVAPVLAEAAISYDLIVTGMCVYLLWVVFFILNPEESLLRWIFFRSAQQCQKLCPRK